MKRKIAILGSTGSIGKSTLEVIKKDKKSENIAINTDGNNVDKEKKVTYLIFALELIFSLFLSLTTLKISKNIMTKNDKT